jgi:carotenoid cleavage dioxygenase-like enzyme
VLAEFPFVVNPLALALSGRPYIENYRWKPELGTRFTLVDRASGKATTGFKTDACFAFHHVNAFEDGGEVVVDVCAVPDAGIVEDLYLERLRRPGRVSVPRSRLTRFRLKLADRSVGRKLLGEGGVELPRINYGRCNERPYSYVWGNDLGASGWFEQIVKLDTTDGSTLSTRIVVFAACFSLASCQSVCYPGEPWFVARPDADAEDDGVLLSVVLDAAAGTSFMLVLDARDLTELARAEVPHHIPFSFHGQFARA